MTIKKPHRVELYVSNKNSKLSELAKSYFINNTVNFDEIIIDHDETARQKMEEISGQRIPPVAVIDDRVIAGFQPNLYDIILFGAESD